MADEKMERYYRACIEVDKLEKMFNEIPAGIMEEAVNEAKILLAQIRNQRLQIDNNIKREKQIGRTENSN